MFDEPARSKMKALYAGEHTPTSGWMLGPTWQELPTDQGLLKIGWGIRAGGRESSARTARASDQQHNPLGSQGGSAMQDVKTQDTCCIPVDWEEKGPDMMGATTHGRCVPIVHKQFGWSKSMSNTHGTCRMRKLTSKRLDG